MTPAITLALVACGVFFLTGLLTGVWKWRAMLSRSTHRAPFYVDTAHRAALLYSFACLVLARFAGFSPFSRTLTFVAAALPILFFGIAVATYIRLGITDATDNQFERRNFVTTTGMVLLVIGEVGGFSVLFVGFLLHIAA